MRGLDEHRECRAPRARPARRGVGAVALAAHAAVAHLRDAARGHQVLEEHLVHAHRRGGHAGAHVGDVERLEHPLHRAVLAERPVQHREGDVDAEQAARPGAARAARRPRATRRRARSRRAAPRGRPRAAPRAPTPPRRARRRARRSARPRARRPSAGRPPLPAAPSRRRSRCGPPRSWRRRRGHRRRRRGGRRRRRRRGRAEHARP